MTKQSLLIIMAIWQTWSVSKWTWIRVLWALTLLGKKHNDQNAKTSHHGLLTLVVVTLFRWNPFPKCPSKFSLRIIHHPEKLVALGCPHFHSVICSLRLARGTVPQYLGFHEISLCRLLDSLFAFHQHEIYFLVSLDFVFMTWVFSMSFNYWMITTWPLDYGRERTACIYLHSHAHIRKLFLFYPQVFPDGDVKQHVPINITRQRYTWSGWKCGCSKVRKPWLLFVKGDFFRILPSASSPCFTIFGEYVRNFFHVCTKQT